MISCQSFSIIRPCLNSFVASKPFLKSCKPYFSQKHYFGDSKIASNENCEILTENIKIAKTFNLYFEPITDSLVLFDWPFQLNISDGKVQNIVRIFSSHPSIIRIKQKFKLSKKFFFQYVSEATLKVVKNLRSDKATAGAIPVNILKNSEICFLNGIKKPIRNNKFPDSLKLSNVTPVYKKLDPSDKVNYRLVSVLALLSTVFEKKKYDQFYEHRETSFFCYCVVSEKHIPYNMLSSGGYVGTILMNLSKAYDC